jgi:hypothetical protein
MMHMKVYYSIEYIRFVLCGCEAWSVTRRKLLYRIMGVWQRSGEESVWTKERDKEADGEHYMDPQEIRGAVWLFFLRSC